MRRIAPGRADAPKVQQEAPPGHPTALEPAMPTRRAALAALALLVATARADVDLDDCRPGLIATFRDSTGAQIVRLEPAVAVALAAGEASHPRLAADGGTVRWQGHLNVLRGGDHRFAATLRGTLTVVVAGQTVLARQASGVRPVTVEGPVTNLKAGVLPFEAEFVRAPGAARAELFWEA